MEPSSEKYVSPEKGNRKARRNFKRKFGIWFAGVQDSHEATHCEYHVPLQRTSKAGVVYTYYKKVVDVKKKKE